MTMGIWIFIGILALVSILSIAAIVMYDLNGNGYEDYQNQIRKDNEEMRKEEEKDE